MTETNPPDQSYVQSYLSLASLVLFVLLVVGAFMRHQHIYPFRDPQSAAVLGEKLSTQVSNGRSPAEVMNILNAEMEPTKESTKESVLKFMKRDPSLYPDGYQHSDEFFTWWSTDGVGVNLQFRDGKLINHQPQKYQDLSKMVMMSRLSP